jgi:hypothetical protein
LLGYQSILRCSPGSDISEALLKAKFYLMFLLLFTSQLAQADALMRSEAIKASAIIQYHVDEQGVRADLEIGLAAIPGFSSLLPDQLYQEMGFGDTPLETRLQNFFIRELAVLVEGEPLPGGIVSIGPSKKVLRDPITGSPLPVQEEAPHVLRARLFYPFPDGESPSQLVFIAPPSRDIGFVVYHRGVAVNDYRYLASGYVLELDWEDPWYSSFTVRSLKRQYAAPMSGFIYVENFEVRKEIIVRPKDLQRWIDLGLADRDDIPVEMQAPIKEKVAAFLAEHHAVLIDGEPFPGILESVNFLERTLTSSRVIDPPEPLDLDAAIIGTIFVYPRSGLPQSVVMEWDLWDERIQRVPVSAVDEAGPLPSYLEPGWSSLEWTNFLKNPYVPTLAVVESPVAHWRQWLDTLLPWLAGLTLASLLWAMFALRGRKSLAVPGALSLAFAVASVAASQLGGNNRPGDARATAITGDLLQNIYRAFDYREESDIYDMLARSVTGDLLTDIFLETKRSLVLANQGGAAAKVKEVVVDSVEVRSAQGDDSFTVEADWTVHGSVGHWGHVHRRSNRYLAELTIAVDHQQWKLRDMTVLQEERL